jgi:hypothetical protein
VRVHIILSFYLSLLVRLSSVTSRTHLEAANLGISISILGSDRSTWWIGTGFTWEFCDFLFTRTALAMGALWKKVQARAQAQATGFHGRIPPIGRAHICIQFVSYSFFFVLLELLEFTVEPKPLTHQANLFSLHIVSETHRTMGLQTLRRFQHQRSEQNHHSPDANQLNTTQPLAPP